MDTKYWLKLFKERHIRNIRKWGQEQTVETLALVASEEAGETAQAVLMFLHEGHSEQRIIDESIDLAAACIALCDAAQRFTDEE